MSDPTRRALRTLFQFVASGGLTAFVTEVVAEVDDARWVSLIMAVSLLVVTYAQNELEDMGAIPAVLKAPASDGEHPVPGDLPPGDH